MLCNREGNRRSGVALAMRHRLCGLSTYGLSGFDREMSTPPTLRRGTADFFLPVQQCHAYLLTYYPTGTQVPAKLPGRVPG